MSCKRSWRNFAVPRLWVMQGRDTSLRAVSEKIQWLAGAMTALCRCVAALAPACGSSPCGASISRDSVRSVEINSARSSGAVFPSLNEGPDEFVC